MSDVQALLGRLGDLADQIVLVGGQAVNVWSEHYLAQGRAPDLVQCAPFTSKDVDFCGPSRAAITLASRVHKGRARVATIDDHTPNVAAVTFVDDGGHERVIDVLSAPFGMNGREVLRRSLPLQVLDEDGAPSGLHFRVMHPLDCLESRVHNVIGLPNAYDTPRGRNQLRAAVVCAREALKDTLDAPEVPGFEPVRATLGLNERIFALCLRDRNGRVVQQRTGVDPFDAVNDDERLGELFLKRRLPQMRERLAALRKKLAR